MTWQLIDVDIQQRVVTPQELQRGVLPGLGNLVRTVVGTFDDFDSNGVAANTPHVYTEPNVSDCSPLGIAKLMRDHADQLNRIQGVAVGKLAPADLSSLRTLMTAPRLAPAAAAAVRAVVDFSRSDQDHADALNAEMIANPSPQPTRTAPIDITALIGALSDQAQAALAANPNTAVIRDDARRGDGQAIVNWAGLMVKAGSITPDDYGVVVQQCTPQPDPAWPAQVSRAVSILGRDATAGDIAFARVAG